MPKPSSERLPATLSALCRSPLAETPEGLALARRFLATPRGQRYIRGVGRLLCHNGDPYAPPRATRLAAERDQPKLLELFVQAGAWLEDPRPCLPDDPAGFRRASSPLAIAAEAGSYRASKALLQLGADPNGVDESGYAPLHLAARGGHADLFPLLCAHGANPNAAGHNDSTPLIEALPHAMSSGDIQPIDALIALGADINQASDGMSPIHYAASDAPNSAWWIQSLLARGARVDPPGLFGTPFLSLFLEEGDVTAPALALLKAGANPDAVDDRGHGAAEDEYTNPSALAVLLAWRESAELHASTPAARKAEPSIRM